VLAEPTLLKRAISNVVRNSVRYAGTYGPIEISTETNEDFVDLVIEDSGPEVPPETLKFLGQPFYRPEPSRDRMSGGVGLGLAIVKTCWNDAMRPLPSPIEIHTDSRCVCVFTGSTSTQPQPKIPTKRP